MWRGLGFRVKGEESERERGCPVRQLSTRQGLAHCLNCLVQPYCLVLRPNPQTLTVMSAMLHHAGLTLQSLMLP